MSTTKVLSPTSRVRFGLARVDITPPVGIYHRMWGAARHDRATGVHRPLTGEVMLFAPLDGSTAPWMRVQLDLVGLASSQYEELAQAVSAGADMPREQVVIAFSHSHSAGFFMPDRVSLPGGERIVPYLQKLRAKLEEAARRAAAGIREATLTYAAGRCSMNASRDYPDEDSGGFVCGFNPDAPADETVLVARITDGSGGIIATVVNYGCHPTTLAWQNTLLSPDYPGAMRELVERETGAPCVFALGACGDLGPRHGFVGDPAAADRNGRQLAYAALSALESMAPPNMDFRYAGPVLSGATLGEWTHVPLDGERRAAAARFGGGAYTVDLPLKAIPDRAALEREVEQWEARGQEAGARGDTLLARDCRARAERARRWLGRIAGLPEERTYPLRFSIHRMGDAAWVTCAGEPYSAIQAELRRRFPDLALLFSPLAGGIEIAYLLPADRYSQGLYQEEPSILAPGCLERLTEAIAGRISDQGSRR